jgi:hypothetical protein
MELHRSASSCGRGATRETSARSAECTSPVATSKVTAQWSKVMSSGASMMPTLRGFARRMWRAASKRRVLAVGRKLRPSGTRSSSRLCASPRTSTRRNARRPSRSWAVGGGLTTSWNEKEHPPLWSRLMIFAAAPPRRRPPRRQLLLCQPRRAARRPRTLFSTLQHRRCPHPSRRRRAHSGSPTLLP